MPVTIEWEPKENYEIEGQEVIAWLCSHKGFKDITAILIFHEDKWYWNDIDDIEPVGRPDLIRGVVPWPEPPVEYSYDGEN